MSRVNGGFQMIPGCIARYCAICRQNKAVRRIRQYICCGPADCFQTARGKHAFAFQSAHERPSEQLRGLFRTQTLFAYLQTAIHHVAGVIQERC